MTKRTAVLSLAVLCSAVMAMWAATPVMAVGDVVISQVYGGGGNSGSYWKQDFIELFNRGTTTINITGWSVQYASATGSTWSKTDVSGSLAPGQYYLIREAQGSGGTADLPSPDVTGTIAMGGTAGKVALVNNTTLLTGTCPTGANIVDFVGFGTTANCYEGTGPTPAPSNTTSVERLNAGCTDTDQNNADFVVSAVPPTPRNSGTPLNPCGGPPTAACCYGTYLCVVNTQAECSALSGTWLSGETSCASNPCGYPTTGSCCLPNGTCALGVTQAECTAQGGSQFTLGASDCVPACVPITFPPIVISEYYESAPGNRKAIEIYNTSASTVDLTGAKLALYANAAITPSATFALTGTIPAHGVLVFVNNLTDTIPGLVGTPIEAAGVCSFNGDDAIAILFNVNGVDLVVDAFAVPGQQDSGPRAADPYADAAWERACSVTVGTADFDPCNFDGLKDCGLAVCPPGTPTTCTDGAHANEWVFEGLNPAGDNTHHTLGSHCSEATGACCNGETCTIATATDCLAGSGLYQGDDSVCDPNPCLPPTGACCVAGICQATNTQSECDGLGGSWYLGESCPAFSCPVLPSVIINETDSDTPGTDVLEFIELYDGGIGNTALDGLVVVLYNGNGDVSYAAYDLDGFSTDPQGYFLLGNTGVVPTPSITFPSNTLQNGADAVALYVGDATSFPNGTAVTTANLVDAIVYGTDDPDDAGLLVLLNVGQPQANEGIDAVNSLQRCPNGSGGARNTDTYQQWLPTPGGPNLCLPPSTGACCVEATCTVMTPEACSLASGTYLGDGSTCTNVVCGCLTAAGAKAQQGVLDGSGVIVCDVTVSNLTSLINSGTVKSFQVQDATGGMTVFASNSVIDALLLNLGDPIQEGHTITISGTTDEYNGLFELSQGPPLPLKVLAKSGAITPVTPEPILPADLQDANPTAELLESRLVKLMGVTFIETGTFAYLPSGGYHVTDGINTAVVRIATESLDMIGTAIPTVPVDIVGIVSQYDTTDPYNGAYQLLPRSLADITLSDVGCTCPGNTTDDANNRVDENDIPSFIQALLEVTPHECADVNGDEVVDGRDIQLFVERALALTPCGPVVPPSRAVVECVSPSCQGDQIGIGWCHYEVIAETVPGVISCAGYGLGEGVLFCVPCDGQCDPAGTIQTFKWVDRVAPGVHCYFKAQVYQPLTPCYVSCPGGLTFDNYP